MLYRRHLRIKVLQALYAWFSGSTEDLPQGERQLLLSINKLYELFIYQLSFLIEVKRFAENQIEERRGKFYPTKEDIDPNLKFLNNQVFAAIEENKDFLKKEQLYKINWADEQDMVRKFYKNLQETEYYKKYMASSRQNFEEDKKLMVQIVDQMFPDFELLRSFYEEKTVFFVDGYDLVNILLIKFFDTNVKDLHPGTSLPAIYKTDGLSVNDDLEFVKKLYRKVILNDAENNVILEEKTSTWDFDRIPIMDVILLKMAVVELKEMETVPVKVTLNEYIELAKYFSPAKSRNFVNGVLDRLIKEFKEQGTINKVGRGLVE